MHTKLVLALFLSTIGGEKLLNKSVAPLIELSQSDSKSEQSCSTSTVTYSTGQEDTTETCTYPDGSTSSSTSTAFNGPAVDPDYWGEDGPLPTLTMSDSELEKFNQIQLDAHDYYRSLHGTGPMEIDMHLAKGAQAWAQKMSDENNMQHSAGGDWGENLAMNSQQDVIRDTANATDMWYGELYDPGYDFNSPGFGHGTGHFTQVVWKASTKLGCGYAGVFAVCRYSPAGNMSMPGYFEDNVLPLV